MASTPLGNGSKSDTPAFRGAGRWFGFLVFFLFLWTGIYIYTHQNRIFEGYQLRQLSRSHIDKLNRILYEAATPVVQAPQIIDTVQADSANASPDSGSAKPVKAPQQLVMNQVCDDSCRIDKAMLFVRTQFDNKIRKDEEDVLRSYIRTYNGMEVGSLLEDLNLKVDSYFWLSGPYMYLEMIFWVIFGVICSNLFAISIAGRARGGPSFTTKDIPYQAAKFFYAPVFTIILILAYNYFRHSEVSEVNATQGTIVFSFIAGLFSSGLMGFLERFKNTLFPEEGTLIKPVVVSAEQEGRPDKSQAREEVVVKERTAIPLVEKEPDAVINDLYKAPETPKSKEEELEVLSSTMVFTPAEEEHPQDVPADNLSDIQSEAIPQVIVMLNLDISGLYEEEKNEIIDIGFANAVVTMHNVNGREIITARKSDDKYTASFVAPEVKPGIYIVRCTLTQKLSDDYTINLFGEKTVYVTHENTTLELFIKKYEAID